MLGFIYSIASYVMFLAAYTYFAWFSDGVGVPKTVDSRATNSLVLAAVINSSLVLLFGLQHSIMARARFKRVLTRIIPAAVERATFVLASSVTLVLLMWQWRPIRAVLWSVDSIGVEYERYQASTPRFLPVGVHKDASTVAPSSIS